MTESSARTRLIEAFVKPFERSSVNSNAGLYANELGTVLGQNDIQVKDQVTPQIKATTGSTSTPQPNFALDVGQLGGMYAGKIFLVGTEQGLGVRNAGSINSTQSSLTLNTNGDLVNSGNLIANKDQVQLKAQNIQNTGNISSATSQISVESQNLNNSGLISSADELKAKLTYCLDIKKEPEGSFFSITRLSD